MLVEICIDSVEGAIAAQAGGAQRVELCADLLEGGITPSAGMITQVRKRISLALNVIIRPRGADFLYSEHELVVMAHDIQVAKDLGADGVVIGMLTAEGAIDSARTARLLDLARPLPVTFHRAFDMTRDPFAALDTLIDLGVDRLLTSGQQPTALAGLTLIKQLVERAAGRIVIMPGGGIDENNVGQIVAETAVSEVHFSARRLVHSGMNFRNPQVFMGGTSIPEEFAWKVTNAERVRRIIERLRDGDREEGSKIAS